MGSLDAVFNEGGAAQQGGENVCKTLLQLGYLGSLTRRKMALRMDRCERCHFLPGLLLWLCRWSDCRWSASAACTCWLNHPPDARPCPVWPASVDCPPASSAPVSGRSGAESWRSLILPQTHRPASPSSRSLFRHQCSKDPCHNAK